MGFKRYIDELEKENKEAGFGKITFLVGPDFDEGSNQTREEFFEDLDNQSLLIDITRLLDIKNGKRSAKFDNNLVENAILESDYGEGILRAVSIS